MMNTKIRNVNELEMPARRELMLQVANLYVYINKAPQGSFIYVQ